MPITVKILCPFCKKWLLVTKKKLERKRPITCKYCWGKIEEKDINKKEIVEIIDSTRIAFEV